MERLGHGEPRAQQRSDGNDGDDELESHFTSVRRVALVAQEVGVMVEQLWLRGIDRWSYNGGERAWLHSSWAWRERDSE